MLRVLQKELANTQNCTKQFADRRRSDREFEVGDRVDLKLRKVHLQTFALGQHSKLSSNFFSPYPIMARIGKVAYKLQLPLKSQVHPIFHVSLLKKSARAHATNTTLPTLLRDTTRAFQRLWLLWIDASYIGMGLLLCKS